MNYKEKRPWGSFENILDQPDCKVKKIIVNPGQSPSYQYHFKRNETHTVISGKAVFILDDTEIEVLPGKSIFIPALAKHTVKNVGTEDVVIIEIQTGTYFGEDDIVRISDIYGRI